MNKDELYIRRCNTIGRKGLGTTRPNPMVGCVIVLDDTIIGEGFTSPYGQSHAEVNAINSVKDQSLLSKATLYVTLEPCSHYGKTPPCSDLIIRKNIPRVVIGCVDDNPEVAGRGIKRLQDSGCEVVTGVLEDECRAHLKRFFTFHNKKRPYIILKWAQTQNGFIAPISKSEKKPVWITNPYSRQLVHQWRSEEHAILVGTTTVTEDNPSLTVRNWSGSNPVRVIIDRSHKLSKSLDVFDNKAETLVISENEVNFNSSLAQEISHYLYEKNIQSIIIEGGTKTINNFINEDLWDEARVFYGNNIFEKGVMAPELNTPHYNETRIEKDILRIYTND